MSSTPAAAAPSPLAHQPSTIVQRDRRVILNCGGRVSQISLALLQKHPQTLLAQISQHLLTQTTPVNEICFDRDPESFNVILNWYRYGKLVVPASVPYELVADDIVYFQLPVVIDASKHTSSTLTSSAPGGLVSMSRAASTVVEYPAQTIDGDETNTTNSLLPPASPSQPVLLPALSHLPSFAMPNGIYSSMDEDAVPSNSGMPVVNILPPTPPLSTPGVSFIAPTLIHQPSGVVTSGPTLMSPTHLVTRPLSPRPPVANPMANYLNLGAGDVDQTQSQLPVFNPAQMRAASVAVQGTPHADQHHHRSGTSVTPNSNVNPHLVKSATQASTSSSSTPGVYVAVDSPSTANTSVQILSPVTPTSLPTSTPPLATVNSGPYAQSSLTTTTDSTRSVDSSNSAVSSQPQPRVPFDLAIESLSCFKDLNRTQALALLDGSGSGGKVVPEGSYLFRYCSDAAEKDASGNINKDLFVLSYIHDHKMYNTKIFRLYLGEKNSLGASTCRGYVLTEHKEPTKKEHVFGSIIEITLAIIGPQAQELH